MTYDYRRNSWGVWGKEKRNGTIEWEYTHACDICEGKLSSEDCLRIFLKLTKG